MQSEKYRFSFSPAKAAELLGVTPKTLARWAEAGKIECIYTEGGHRRYPFSAVHQMVQNKYADVTFKHYKENKFDVLGGTQ